jgi:NarL family two-component system sensor histidine kinase YdfH
VNDYPTSGDVDSGLKIMPPKSQYVGLIFYIFVSIVLVSLAVSGTRAMSASVPIPLIFLYLLLFGIHIGLYWVNLRLHPSRRWSFFYYLLQAGLIIALFNFPYGSDSISIGVLGSSSLCIIGETLGLWGNTRRSLSIGIFYAGLAAVLLFSGVEPEVLGAAISAMLFNTIFIILFMIVLNQQLAERDKAQELAENLESANAQLAANAAQIESLTLQNERQRMARELHDTLAQGVAGLVLQLEAIKAHLSSDRVARASVILDQALTRARSILAESRAAIDDLRSVPANLAESVREKVDRFAQGTGIPCELDLSVQENKLSSEVADHALNILGEALANVTKHARATKIAVRFRLHKDRLELEVHDDGSGFEVREQTGAGHYGLLGMRERARLSGGVLSIESNPQHGTVVRFVVVGAQAGATE